MGAVWLLDLPEVLARKGGVVRTWGGWETRSRGSGGYNALYAVGVHHTASDTSWQNDCSYMWGNSPNEPVGAVHLDRQGVWTIGAAGATNTQGKGGPWTNSKGQITPRDSANSYWISIEAANAGTGQAWPGPQLDAYVNGCAALCEAYNLSAADVQAHFEWTTRKIDPWGPPRYAGNGMWDMAHFRRDVAAAMGSNPPSTSQEDTMYVVKNTNQTIHVGNGVIRRYVATGDANELIAAALRAGTPLINWANGKAVESSNQITPLPGDQWSGGLGQDVGAFIE
jgi:hypothetical protein